MIRKIKGLLIPIILLSLLLCSCTGGTRDDLSIAQIEEKLSTHMENYEEMQESSAVYLEEVFNIDTEDARIEEIVSKRSFDTHVDQFGIICAKDEQFAKELESELKTSLENFKNEWDSRYFPEENAKISSATVTRTGKYVLFSILSPKETQALSQTIKETLKK